MLNDLVEDLKKLMNKHNIKSIGALKHEEESYIKMDEDGQMHLVGLRIRSREKCSVISAAMDKIEEGEFMTGEEFATDENFQM